MDSGPKASLCHGEHIRVQRMSCRVIEGFTLVHRLDRKASEMIPDPVQVIKEFQRTKGACCCARATQTRATRAVVKYLVRTRRLAVVTVTRVRTPTLARSLSLSRSSSAGRPLFQFTGPF